MRRKSQGMCLGEMPEMRLLREGASMSDSLQRPAMATWPRNERSVAEDSQTT